MPEPAPTHESRPRSGELIRPVPRRGRRSSSKPSKARPAKPVGLGAKLLLLILVFAAFGATLANPVLWSGHAPAGPTAFDKATPLREIWSPQGIRQADPLSRTSLRVEQLLPLPAAAVHRALNLLLHGAAALLLLRLLTELRIAVAYAVALVFALHPTVLPTLFWPGYRSELFALVAILAALVYGVRNCGSRDFAACLLLSAIAMTTHPAALSLPLLLGLCIVYREKRPHLHHFNRVLPLLCLSLFVAVWVAPARTTALAGADLASKQLVFFLRQALLPFELALFHPVPGGARFGVGSEMNLLPFFLLLPFLILIAINFSKAWSRALLLGIGSYLLLLLPGLLTAGKFINGDPAFLDADHYLALPAVIALFIGGIGSFFKRLGPGAQPLWLMALSVLLLIQLTLSGSFAAVLHSPPKMWETISTTWPAAWQPKAAYLAATRASGEVDLPEQERIEILHEILDAEPTRLATRKELARTYREAGQPNNAVRQYKRILRHPEPGEIFLKEAAAFFEQCGLNWEADNVRRRLADRAP